MNNFLTQILALSIDNGRDAPGWVNIDYLVFEYECGMNGADVYWSAVWMGLMFIGLLLEGG